MQGEPPAAGAGTTATTTTPTHGFLTVPEQWTTVARRRVVGFATSFTWKGPDGRLITWASRAHRKRDRGSAPDATWWAPWALGWWVAILFIIGSACFVARARARIPRVGRVPRRRADVLRRVGLLHVGRVVPVHRDGHRAAFTAAGPVRRPAARFSASSRPASTGGLRRCSSSARSSSTSRPSRR